MTGLAAPLRAAAASRQGSESENKCALVWSSWRLNRLSEWSSLAPGCRSIAIINSTSMQRKRSTPHSITSRHGLARIKRAEGRSYRRRAFCLHRRAVEWTRGGESAGRGTHPLTATPPNESADGLEEGRARGEGHTR